MWSRNLVGLVALLTVSTAVPALATEKPLMAASIDAVARFNEFGVATDVAGDVIGSVPGGSFVEEVDPTCPATGGASVGSKIYRYWLGSTETINSISAADPSTSACDTSREEGEDSTSAYVLYHWTTWPADDARAGLRCSDQGFGSIDLATPLADPNDNSAITTLYICAITLDWAGYEDVYYKASAFVDGTLVTDMGHPLASNGRMFVKPANMKLNNSAATRGFGALRTWGCDWVPTAKPVCVSDPSVPCTAACYKEGGCTFDDSDITYKSLFLDQVVVEVLIDADVTSNPPDIYLYKPHPLAPDGLPAESGNMVKDWDTTSFLEARLSNLLSPYFPASLKYATVADEADGDIFAALSTDNLRAATVTGGQTAVIFDDEADVAVSSVDTLRSASFEPEDRLSLFNLRLGKELASGTVGLGGAGAGTWAVVVIDDCGESFGVGASLESYQLHFVCKEAMFCKQSGPSPGPEGSASGDPHFVGFQGQRFDYNGVPGAAFNVVSTPSVLINALLSPDMLEGLTYMTSVAIASSLGRVRVSVDAALERLVVELNDAVVEELDGSRVALQEGGARVAIEIPGEMELELSLHKGKFIDVSAIRLLAMPREIHGVLGNTANLDPDMDDDVVGEDSHYFVSNLWAADSTYNVYTGEAPPNGGAAPRKAAAVAAGVPKFLTAQAVNVD